MAINLIADKQDVILVLENFIIILLLYYNFMRTEELIKSSYLTGQYLETNISFQNHFCILLQYFLAIAWFECMIFLGCMAETSCLLTIANAGPKTTVHIIGRFDPWGCFDAFDEPLNCTYDEAVAVCKRINLGREPWMRFGVHRPPIRVSTDSSFKALENVAIRRFLNTDLRVMRLCMDIAIRCLQEYGLKIKLSQLGSSLALLASNSLKVSTTRFNDNHIIIGGRTV